MMKQERETLGQAATRLAKVQLESDCAYEHAGVMFASYGADLAECVKLNLPILKNMGRDHFFISMITIKDRLFKNYFKQKVEAHQACPTPTWDQIIYRYDIPSDALEFLWVIPDKITCEDMYKFPHLVPLDEYELLGYVKDFYEGALLRKANTLNKDTSTPPVIKIVDENDERLNKFNEKRRIIV